MITVEPAPSMAVTRKQNPDTVYVMIMITPRFGANILRPSTSVSKSVLTDPGILLLRLLFRSLVVRGVTVPLGQETILISYPMSPMTSSSSDRGEILTVYAHSDPTRSRTRYNGVERVGP